MRVLCWKEMSDKLRAGLVCLGCFSFLLSGAVQAMDWSRYVNARFGTSASVPAHFHPVSEAANGDGQVFIHPGGRGEIRIWGGYNVMSDDMAGYRQERIHYLAGDGAEITYSPKGRNWFVLSGYQGGEIFYLKVMHGAGCSAELVHHISFRYPERDRELWDEIVDVGSRSLSGPCP